jgi:threonine/homoserine/homoserine lactone efflux protein
MDLLTLTTFTVAYAIFVLVPGPGVAAVVARALGGGFTGALPMVLGIIVGDLFYFLLAAFGLAAIANWFAPILVIVRWAGAAYLLYIAWKFWTARPGSEMMRPKNEDAWKTWLSGFSLTIGNPKTIVFYAAILPTLIPLGEMDLVGYLELTAIVAVVIFVIGCGYAWLASAARELFRSPVALGRLNKTAGAMMAGAAALIAFQH